MAKSSTKFVCQECGAILSKWMGQCDVCKSWNSVVEELSDDFSSNKKDIKIPDDFFKTLNTEEIQDNTNIKDRYITSINELNRVLGGGFVEGSVILLGGAPGIGKSTLLLQMLKNISGIENYLYISAEESVSQVSMRAKRLSVLNKNIKIASCSDIEQITASLSAVKNSSIAIIDSIQTVSTNIIQSPTGSISQVRYCTQELVNIAKKNGIVIVIVGHITKDGAIAGPKTLEHMVDCVLYFEGERSYDYRILRVSKNRFGATDEIGVFGMTGEGLEEISNPSSAFLSVNNNEKPVSGVAVFSGIEGTRPILSEIQALVSTTGIPMPRRSSIGFDSNRLSMLVAVLSNRCKLNFSNKDVYLNIAGGLKITEPAIDLAVIASILSSAFQKPLPEGSVFFGEISLSGEIRQSHLSFSRIKEAQKLGFSKIYCSERTEQIANIDGIEIIRLNSIKNLISQIFR